MAKSGKSHLVFHKTCLPIVTMNDYRHFATGPYSRGTPPRRGAHGHGGCQAPEPQLPPGGTQIVPQICTDVRTRDVGLDQRNDAWSPENLLVDTVARMQQYLADIRAENRLVRTLGVPLVVHTPRQADFTTTKVPRFGGTTSLEQYRQVFDTIVLSNGWDDATARYSCSPTLNVALFVPMSRRTSRTGLVDIVGALWVAMYIRGL